MVYFGVVTVVIADLIEKLICHYLTAYKLRSRNIHSINVNFVSRFQNFYLELFN